MKTEKIIWGIILVFVGGVLLLQNFEVINFNWGVIFRFWPLILIIIGANLVFSPSQSSTGAVIAVLITVLALGFITFKGLTTAEEDDNNWTFDFRDRHYPKDNGNEHSKSNTFTEVYTPNLQKAVLNISGGATQYILTDTTNSLFEADVKRGFGNYTLRSKMVDSSQVLDFKMVGKQDWNMKNNKGSKVYLRLNTKPVWDINLEMGAAKSNFDLSAYKINKLSIQGGAASFELKLGQPERTTNVSVETGVSKVVILIPEGVACKINTETGLSSSDFDGFTEQADGSFTTSNFNGAAKTMVLSLEGGLSDFKVKRY